MQGTLCERVIKLDKNIRFAGVVDARGEVVEGGFQQGTQPLLNGTAEQQMYLQALSNVLTLRQFSDRLGEFRYSITEHGKVNLLTFPLGDGILCLSTSSKANTLKIRDKVRALLKKNKKPAKKKI
jgi:hypothetical protein